MRTRAHVIKTTKDDDVTAQQLSRDVMTNFVESRYSDWFMNLDYKREDVEADLLDITQVSFEEFDEGTMEPLVDEDGNRRVYVITHKQIQLAMKRIAEGQTNVASDIAELIKDSYKAREYLDLDALTDDCIVQVAAFGQLVYG